jgi:hypothetical protein
MPLSPSSDANFLSGTERNSDIIEFFIHKAEFLSSLRDGLLPKILRLLVTMSGMISQDNYRRMGSLLWHQCLESNNPHVTASVRSSLAFLGRSCDLILRMVCAGMLFDNAMCREDPIRIFKDRRRGCTQVNVSSFLTCGSNRLNTPKL